MKEKFLIHVLAIVAIVLSLTVLAVPVMAKPFQVDVTVKDSAGNPLQNIWVTVGPSPGSLSDWVQTNLRGKASVPLDRTLAPSTAVEVYVNPDAGTYCSLCPDSGLFSLTRQNSGRITFTPCPAAETTLCISGCSNLQTDAGNCGTCGNACSFPNAGSACSGGACSLGACDSGYGNCDSTPGNGCEASLTAPENCGSCGTVCSFPNANPECIDEECSLGTCDSGYGNCDSSHANGCETSLTTSQNCGSCGTVCSFPHAESGCYRGIACRMYSCTEGYGDCNGQSSDGCETGTSNDVENCGSCGNVCSFPNANPVCNNGGCTFDCDTDYADCDAAIGNGCEIQLGTTANCGYCGDECSVLINSNAVASCSGRECTPVCDPGYGNCDATYGNGCETLLDTTDNCASCGDVCTVANGEPSCSGGVCSIWFCGGDYEDCDGDYYTGCETDIYNGDIANCGSCGNACSQDNGVAECTNGECSITCDAGYADCNWDDEEFEYNDGCETNTDADRYNCGGCGNYCSLPNTETPSCVSGECVVDTCNSDYGDCHWGGEVWEAGCETYLAGDKEHCGDCYISCEEGEYCSNGICTSIPS